MALRFDATLKEAVQVDPAGYAARFGLPTGKPTQMLNVDLSAISAATDAAIGVGDPLEEIADFNFQSGPDPKLPDRVLLYNSVFRYRNSVPVRSIVVLLCPRADHPNLTGLLTYGEANHRLEFRYEVVRLWKEPFEFLLTGSLGLVPLAVLGQLPTDREAEEVAHEIIRRIEERLLRELPRDKAVILMQAAAILTGLRFEDEGLDRIFEGVGLMSETTTFDWFTRIGEIRQLHKTLLRLGRERFGAPDAATEAALTVIKDSDRLDRMTVAVLTATNWKDLLSTP